MARKQKSRGIVGSLGDLFFTIAPDMGGFESQLTKGLEVAAAGTAANVGAALENLGLAMVKKFTAPLAIATAANIAQFQALDREIRSVITLFGTAPSLLDETWDRMSEGITQVSRDVGGLEKDIADGLYQAISAGVPEDTAFEFLDVAQMAAIADKTSDLTTAVDAITTVLNAFKSEGLEAAEASDILFAAVTQGKTTFGELGASIGRAAGSAANAGVKAAEFAAIIATITQGGLETSESVSYLRAAITGLLRPSEDMNAIFEQMGFASAEAAIPIIGLQPAFQAVVEAAGGSTSRLQELVGTAEGVSAILAVTGENADSFAKSLNATESAAGNTARAFSIVDAGVGRSFGKLTEAFDRLGNYFGKLSSQLVQPLVDFATDVVNRVADIFRRLEPVFDALISVVQGFFAILEQPVVKQFAATIAAIAISIGGVLGVMGPLVLVTGKLITNFVRLLIIRQVTKSFNTMKTVGVAAANALGRAYDSVAGGLNSNFTPAAVRANKTITILGRTITKTALKIGLIAGAVGLAVAAIGLAIYAWDRYQKKLEAIDRQTAIATQGVDRMAESLGIALVAVGEIDFEALNVEVGPTFVLKNADVLRQFALVQETLGDEALREVVISFLLDFKNRGAAEDELNTIATELQSALNTNLEIDIDDIVDESKIAGISRQLELVGTQLNDAFDPKALENDYNALTETVKGELRNVSDELAQVYKNQGYDAFVESLQVAEDAVGGFAGAQNYLADEVVKSFERVNDQKYGFDVDGLYTLDGALVQLNERIEGFNTQGAAAFDETQEAIEGLGGLTLTPYDYMTTTREPVSKERIEAEKAAAEAIGTAFQKAEEHISSAFQAVYDGLVNSMPVLDIYAGAVKQSFTEWRKGQDQFQEDIVKVADFREELKGLAPEVLKAFDESSLDKKAWLANLGADEQAIAIEELAESYSAVTDAVDTVWNQDVPGVVAEAKGIIQSEYDAMYAQALTAGAQTGFDYSQAFSEAASAWPGIAQHWLNATAAVLSGGGSGGVALGGPVIEANFNVNNTSVNVTSTSPNPGKQVTAGLQRSGVLE